MTIIDDQIAAVRAALQPIQGHLDAIDKEVRGSRGPRRAVSVAQLVAILLLTTLAQKVFYLERAATVLRRHLTDEQRRQLGFADAVTARQLRITFYALCLHLEDREEAAAWVSTLVNQVLSATAGTIESRTIALDTTKLFAFCKPTSVPSDPDARWHRQDKPKRDGRTETERWLGYKGVAAVAVADRSQPELCVALTLVSTRNDVKASVPLLQDLRRRLSFERVHVDRGFSQDPEFLMGVRDLGAWPTFILKKGDIGYKGKTPDGFAHIDGWLFANPPQHLHNLKRPDIGASDEEWAAYARQADELMAYALVPNGRGTPHKMHLESPAYRNRSTGKPVPGRGPRPGAIDCLAAPPTTQIGDGRPLCPGDHEPDMACAKRTTTWGAQQAPRTFQYPPLHSREHRKFYKERIGVERVFGGLKTPQNLGLQKGAFMVTTLPKVTFAVGIFAAALNVLRRNRRLLAEGPDQEEEAAA